MRIGLAVGTLVALGVPTSVLGQDTPPLQRSPDALEVTITGSARLRFIFRDADLEQARAALNRTLPPAGDDTLVAGEGSVRFDVELPDRARAVVELGNLPFGGGVNLPLARDGLDVVFRQAFFEVGGILAEDLTLRAGAFDYAWRIRPHDEPFLLDLGRSEPFFSGASGTFVRATADRDIGRPGGALLAWRAGDFVEVEALWMTYVERGPAGDDESLGAALVNFPLSERTAVFAGALHVVGGESERVTTFGIGADGYFGRDREIELFGEGYVQTGRLSRRVSRRAFGGQGGIRLHQEAGWFEVSAAYRSGDDNPSDGTDRTFQSYENQARFLLVESAEVGLDWDTNVFALRGVLLWRTARGTTLRLDAGRFRLPEKALDDTGVPFGLGRDLGTEVDATIRWEPSPAVALWATGAILMASDALERLGADRERLAGAFVAGIDARW
jgi:hypothetical protein